jgi:DNA-binding transcriptional MocR family regulator
VWISTPETSWRAFVQRLSELFEKNLRRISGFSKYAAPALKVSSIAFGKNEIIEKLRKHLRVTRPAARLS